MANSDQGRPSSGDQASSQPQSETTDWQSLHLWQIQPVRDVLLFAAIFGLLMLGKILSVVTVPILLAAALAYLFEPVVERLTNRKLVSRPGAAIGIIAGSALAIVLPIVFGVIFATGQAIAFLTTLMANISAVRNAVANPERPELVEALPTEAWERVALYLIEHQDDADEGLADIATGVMNFVEQSGQTFATEAMRTGALAVNKVLGFVASVGLLAFTLFLTAFFFFFICTSYPRFLQFWRDLIPDRDRDRVLDLASKMDRVIAGFIRGRVTIAFIQSIVFSILYWLIGVPAPLIVGPLAGILAIVPYLALITIPITIALMLIEPSSVAFQQQLWWVVIAPTVVYFAVQALDDYCLSPLIQGKSTGMDTPSILFASLAGGVLGGVYGLLLAIPVAACVKILLIEVFWPHFKDWREGKVRDPLPIRRRSPAD